MTDKPEVQEWIKAAVQQIHSETESSSCDGHCETRKGELEQIIMEYLAGVPPTQDEPAYPKPCGICNGVIQSASDLDWHGYGSCRDIPDVTVAALDDTDEAAPDELKAAHDEGIEKAAQKADVWAKSVSCTAHSDDPCCHVRTGTEIAAAIRALRYSGETPQPTQDEPK